jgi:hypothetical protein
MDHSESFTKGMAQRLIAAIEQVSDGCWKIEVWAGALSGLASPVPVYAPGDWIRCFAPLRAPAPAE